METLAPVPFTPPRWTLLLIVSCGLLLWFERSHQQVIPVRNKVLSPVPLLQVQPQEPAHVSLFPDDKSSGAKNGSEDKYDLNARTTLVITTDKGDPINCILWQGHADLIDRRTGMRFHLKGLTRLLNRIDSFGPESFELSSKGTWLMWNNAHLNSYDPAVAKLDGTHYRDLGEALVSAKFE